MAWDWGSIASAAIPGALQTAAGWFGSQGSRDKAKQDAALAQQAFDQSKLESDRQWQLALDKFEFQKANAGGGGGGGGGGGSGAAIAMAQMEQQRKMAEYQARQEALAALAQSYAQAGQGTSNALSRISQSIQAPVR